VATRREVIEAALVDLEAPPKERDAVVVGIHAHEDHAPGPAGRPVDIADLEPEHLGDRSARGLEVADS